MTPHENYDSKDPVKLSSSKKPLVIVILIVVIIAGQFVLRVFTKKDTANKKETFVEDPGRTVFKEEDIAKSLKSFSKETKDSFFKPKPKGGSVLQNEKSKSERLSPISFVKHEENKPVETKPPEMSQITSLGMPLGSKLPAWLKDKIFSYNTESHVEAEISKDMFYLGKLRIPKGTKFYGTASIVHNQDRVNIHFHTMLLPWGEKRQVRAVAHELDGSGGIKGKVHHYWGKRIFVLTGKTILGALTLFTVPNRQDALSLDSQLRLTAASNLSQEASRGLDTVKPEKAITVDDVPVPILVILLESV